VLIQEQTHNLIVNFFSIMEASSSEDIKDTKKLKARFILNQGAFMGLALAVVYYFAHIAGIMDSFFHSLLTWIVFAGFIHVSMVRYREHFLDGLLSYWQGVWMGTRMGILSGIIVGAYLFFYLKVINPGYIEDLIVQMQETYLEVGMEEDEVLQMTETYGKLMINPVALIISGIFATGLWAFLFSLVIAIFQRRKGDPFTEAMKRV